MSSRGGCPARGTATRTTSRRPALRSSRAKLDLAASQEELNVLETYTKKRTEAELKAKAEELVREVERVKLEAEAEMTKAQKTLQTRQQTLASEREILAKLKEQIDACTLRAPQDGQVVYANLGSNSRRSDGSASIELGATVRERQDIINLPDITQMKVECRIHESLISSIREGVPARIRIVSYPDELFNGKVTAVSSVAMSGQWPNTDLRGIQDGDHAYRRHRDDQEAASRPDRDGRTPGRQPERGPTGADPVDCHGGSEEFRLCNGRWVARSTWSQARYQ